MSYSISGITKLLERSGFSYKKPQPVPGKADAMKQAEFVAQLSALKAEKSRKNPILYLDSTHPQHNSHPEYGWLPRGENVKLKTNTGRKRVTLNGALDSETHEIIVREEENLNADNTIKFFQQIDFRKACIAFFKRNNWRYYKKELETLLSDHFQIIAT